MASSQALDLLLTPEVKSRDGIAEGIKAGERVGVLIVAFALWDVAARIIRCILHAATRVVITRFLTEQLKERLQETTEPTITLAARQEVCRKRCSAPRAAGLSLLLTGSVPSQLTVGGAVLGTTLAIHWIFEAHEHF